MKALFNQLIIQPLFNLFVFLYNIVPGNDAGVAIILLTIIIKLALFPLSASSIKSQKAMSELQPKINALKEKYKDDKQGLAQATMELYKNNKVSPFSSCLPMLIQLPILLGLYWMLRAGLSGESFDLLYSFIGHPGELNTTAFGFLDLVAPSVGLAFLAGGAQYLQAKMFSQNKPVVKTDGSKDESMMANMNKQMTYIMPIITIVIGMQLPAGLTLYWFLSTLLTFVQQKILFKKMKTQEAAPEIINP